MSKVTEFGPRAVVEVELKDGDVRTLRFNFNNFARLEQTMAQSMGMTVFEALGKGSLFAIRQALWAGINDRKMTPEQVGKLMDPKRLRYYTDKIVEAFETAGFLNSESDEEADEDEEAPESGELDEDG